MPLLRLDQLKYRERDHLENVFKFWQEARTKFPISQYWDKRLRKHLGTRYDSRIGVFDWDYHMRLRPFGADHITSREYKNWRNNGVAFTWLETETTEPNLTLTTGVFQVGDRLCHHGYLGDIISGPFIAYGLDCEDKDMLRQVNGVQSKRTTEIAERNIIRMMHELLCHQPFVPSRLTDESVHGLVITEVTNTENRNVDAAHDLPGSGDCNRKPEIDRKRKVTSAKETYSAIPVESTQVTFLPVSALTDFPKRDKYKDFFHVVTLSQNMTQFLTEDLVRMVRDGGLIVVESKLFLLELRKENLIEFAKNLNCTAEACRCIPAREYNPLKDPVAMFTVKKHQER